MAYWTDLRSKRTISSRHLTEATCGAYNFYDPLLSPRVGTVDLEPPFDWTGGDRTASWRLNLHSFRFADFWILGYLAKGDPDRLQRLDDVASDYIRRAWQPEDQVTEFVRSDTSVAARAAVLAFLLNQHEAGAYVARDPELLLRALEEHARFAVDDAHYNSNNHGLFNDIHLLMALLNAPRSPVLETAAPRLVERLLTTYLDRQVNHEGIHLEHTPSYAVLWVQLGWKTLEVLDRLGGRYPEIVADSAAAIRKRITLVISNLWWFTTPGGGLVAFGEQGAVSTPDWVRAPRRGGGVKLFKDAGYAMFKEGDSYLAFVCSYHATKVGKQGYRAASHKQRDELHFVWSEKEGDILIDTGLRAFDAGPERRYVTAKQAHNTLSLDPSDYLEGRMLDYMATTSPYGGAIEQAVASMDQAGRQWVVMKAWDPLLKSRGVEHRRIILFEAGNWLLVCDRVRLRKGGRAEWNFHFSERWQCAGYGAGSATFRAGESTLRVSKCGNTKTKGERVSLHVGEFSPLQGWRFCGVPIAIPNLRFAEWLSGGREHVRVHAFRVLSRKAARRGRGDRVISATIREQLSATTIEVEFLENEAVRHSTLAVPP